VSVRAPEGALSTATLAVPAALGSSFLVALAVTPLFRAAARRWGLVDHPNTRSSHRSVIPRAGGLAIVVSALAGVALAHGITFDRKLVAFAVGGLVVGAIGLWDDRSSLPAAPRFLGQVAAGGLLIWVTGPLVRLPLPSPLDLPVGPLGWVVSIVWIVSVVNFFNFMDGIDGLAGLQGVVTGLAIALAGWSPMAQAAGAALAGASAGFLVFNWSPASIFLGDTGSNFLGFAFAALPFMAWSHQRPEAVLMVGLSLWFFLADASLTLVRRVARGERFYEAHRQHLYQRVVDAGERHHRVATGIGLGAALVSALALAGWSTRSPAWSWAAIVLALGLFAVETRIASDRTRQALSRAGSVT
jgi:Fuc2NAc and GlcNAc transferase